MVRSNPGKKIRVAVLYGGRSGEHEISLISAGSVIRHLNRDKYDIIPIAIDKQGKWHLGSLDLLQQGSQPGTGTGRALPVFKDAPEVVLPPNPANPANPASGNLHPLSLVNIESQSRERQGSFDVVFPVLHGPLCEDGTIQGLLELAEAPFVGCGVLASAVGMDKDVAKRLIRDAGLPMVPYLAITSGTWNLNQVQLESQIKSEIGFPCFVKPSNMGSSVGVHKVKSAAELVPALKDAFKYDTKVLVEKAISAREIEVAVLESQEYGTLPRVSVPGEINPTHEFYSYEAKYLDEQGATLKIPAQISESQTKEAQRIAQKAFDCLGCEGMARVDLFLDRGTGEFYFNEVNTIPGFTQISMYPKMWEASGLPYPQLLDELIELALARHRRKQALSRDYLPD